MEKYKVYLSDIIGNAIRQDNVVVNYGVKTNVIFVEPKRLDDIKDINKSLYYYLISENDLDNLEKENEQLKDDIEYWKNRYDNLLKISKVE